MTIRELIVDAYDCDTDLNDACALESAGKAAVASVGAEVADKVSCLFQPHGLTICLVLKESHFIISTWPEYRLAIVNIFLCNAAMDPKACWEHFAKTLSPSEVVVHEVKHDLILNENKQKKRGA